MSIERQAGIGEGEDRMRLQDEILHRGVLDIITEGSLKKRLELGVPLRIKYGIDPTMQSAHIGHATPIRKLRQFQELGHTAVFVIGDYTARIGDPTGKKTTRRQLSAEEVEANAQRYFEQVYKILDRDKTEVHMQSEWYNEITLEEIMRLMSTVTYSRLMAHETFGTRARENRPLGFQELLYPVLQAYDSVMLRADVELGGADQRFNFVLTRDIQKAFGQEPEEVILTKYLPGTDGQEKMSKSLGNTVDLLDTPEDMYAKIMSIADELMPVFFELGTDIPLATIAEMIRQLKAGKLHPMELKKLLAKSITGLYHTEDETESAAAEFESNVQNKNVPAEIPEIRVSDKTVDLLEVLISNGFIKSKSEGRRLLTQRGISVDGATIGLDDISLSLEGKETVIKVGKRTFVKLTKD